MPALDLGDQSWFLEGWRTYRKFLDLNYMFHREVYACLHGVLLTEARRGFRFLDVACGDAAASATALRWHQRRQLYRHRHLPFGARPRQGRARGARPVRSR